jgi:choline dehydrogenase-like flavoprotein
VYSATHLAKTYVDAFRRRSLRAGINRLREQEPLREHWRVLALGVPAAVPELARLARSRWLSKRRLPIVLGPADGRRFAVFFQTEHAPNPNSRVALGTTRDAFGLPRLQVNVAFGDLDIETVIRFHTLLADRLTQTRIGQLRWDPLTARHRLRDQLDNFNSHGHHLGTTRMATRPEDGVVDRDGRVHNVDNLYVAGASVFPTGGHANPTLTLVALSIRLADHLASKR